MLRTCALVFSQVVLLSPSKTGRESQSQWCTARAGGADSQKQFITCGKSSLESRLPQEGLQLPARAIAMAYICCRRLEEIPSRLAKDPRYPDCRWLPKYFAALRDCWPLSEQCCLLPLGRDRRAEQSCHGDHILFSRAGRSPLPKPAAMGLDACKAGPHIERSP